MTSLEKRCTEYKGPEGNRYCVAKVSLGCKYLGPSVMRYTTNKLTKLKSYKVCMRKDYGHK